jgi:hypothetical protein
MTGAGSCAVEDERCWLRTRFVGQEGEENKRNRDPANRIQPARTRFRSSRNPREINEVAVNSIQLLVLHNSSNPSVSAI